MLEIEQAFNTTGTSVYEFFQRPGIGFYIPLYQRDYSWDKNNVEQLLDDISRGIERLSEGNNDDEIRFLGTIISVTEKDKNKIEPIDHRGLPTAIEKIIDGQQRLSTICLFATQLYKQINDLNNSLTTLELKDEVDEICKSWKDKLLDIISLDLKRGEPVRKPKTIRGHDDKWIKDGDLDEAYKSDLSNYLAHFINYINDNEYELPKLNKKNVGKNTKQINKWLEINVVSAHVNNDDEFPAAWALMKSIKQSDIWQYKRSNLLDLINKKETKKKKSEEYIICALVQLFSVCHYLLDRCCFTLIQPLNDDWAFDMFQSLNASGTPLTAIETFKPLVVNTGTIENPNRPFKGSECDVSFENIDRLFENINTAAQKSKMTNDFLTSLAIVIDGYKLTSHFSHQRKWLDKTYEDLRDFKLKNNYIHFVGNYASFYKDVWVDFIGKDNQVLKNIPSNSESELASMILLYLKKSNHKMAVTILGGYYNEVLDGKENSIKNFIDACKAIAAFYTIWRSAQGNSGLDNVYRQFFKGETEKSVKVEAHKWLENKDFEISTLKKYLKDILIDQDIYEKEKWLNKSSKFLKYKSKSIVKFLLILSSHDTIANPLNKGIMKQGNPRVSNYLTVEKWNSKGVETIEHIAPQSKSESWDSKLFDDEELYQSIGNLTLLPTSVNSSAGNKGWKEKLLYYKHLSEQDPDKLEELKTKAKSENIYLNQETIKVLKSAQYNDHIKSIVTLDENGDWDAELVKKRTNEILSIGWDRMINWIS